MQLFRLSLEVMFAKYTIVGFVPETPTADAKLKHSVTTRNSRCILRRSLKNGEV